MPGAYCPPGSTNRSGTLCPAGQYCPGGFGANVLCPPGKHSLTEGASSSDVCLECAAGTYAPVPGATTCALCGIGNWSEFGSSACFSLMLVIIGEWEVIATSAGVGASQTISFTKGITRAAGFEQTDGWASSVTEVVGNGVARSLVQGYETTQGQSSSTEHTEGQSSSTENTQSQEESSTASVETTTTVEVGNGAFNFIGGASVETTVSVETEQSSSSSQTTGTEQSSSTTTGTEQSSSQTSSSQSGVEYQRMVEIGSQLAQEHAATISVALEENEEQTISQSWGNDEASGAGVVWQFKYKIQHIYGSNQIGTQNTVLTDNRLSPPCCLPGTFADHNNPHGPCLPYYPCACSADVCSRAVEAAQESSSTGNVIIEHITNQMHVHMNVKDLQAETNAQLIQIIHEQSGITSKITKMSKILSNLKQNMTEMIDMLAGATANTPRASDSSWDLSLSPAFRDNATDVPRWNQRQYRHCQPVVDSWSDLRQKFAEGSLVMKTGGLGTLSVAHEYEVWVCFLDDACSLGGDYFFCYVFEENTQTFVPWDQHFKLKLFQPKDHRSEIALQTDIITEALAKLLQKLVKK